MAEERRRRRRKFQRVSKKRLFPDTASPLRPGAVNHENKKPKRLAMCQEVYELLSMCLAGKNPDDLAITREDGSPAGDFRKAWRNICSAAGVPGLLVHDLRRSGVRISPAPGLREKTIMEISGHQTVRFSVVNDIVDERDLAEVAAALDRKHLVGPPGFEPGINGL